jgi:hypothetical protein
MIWPFRLIEAVKGQDAIVCRNLEMLCLGFVLKILSGSKAPLTYEVLDIHRKLLGSSPVSRCLRALERFLMNNCHLILTSSPGFIDNYFIPVQRLSGRVHLIENKLLPAAVTRADLSAGPPWVVGWYGIIRCQKSLSMLNHLTRVLPNLSVIISGRVAGHEFDDFEAQIRANPQITYTGPFTPDLLPEIYRQSQFVWAIDYFEEGDNSAWLLPNRLYDSLAFGCVPIALNSVETGRWLMEKDLGLVVSDPLTDLPVLISQLDAARFEALRQAIFELDPQLVFHTESSARALVELISSRSD